MATQQAAAAAAGARDYELVRAYAAGMRAELDEGAFTSTHVLGVGARVACGAGAALACMPCILYSTLVRLVCAAPTCGESIGGGVCGVYVTRSSDRCISAGFSPLTKKAPTSLRARGDLSWARHDAAALAILAPVFAEAAARAAAAAQSPRQTEAAAAAPAPDRRYKLCDWMSHHAAVLGFGGVTLLPYSAAAWVSRAFPPGPEAEAAASGTLQEPLLPPL